MRRLGFPTVIDRFVQQAAMQVLQEAGTAGSARQAMFLPGRSAHQAARAAQGFLTSGRRIVVDIDLKRFFDRINHDSLMALAAKRASDPRLLRLIWAFLTSGVPEDELIGPTDERMPQGGPLSSLLPNLRLDEPDKDLARRGHRFARYADDCNIYVRSAQAGERVMESVERFPTHRLKLKINKAKSAVAPPQRRKFLGFPFTAGATLKRRVAPQAAARLRIACAD